MYTRTCTYCNLARFQPTSIIKPGSRFRELGARIADSNFTLDVAVTRYRRKLFLNLSFFDVKLKGGIKTRTGQIDINYIALMSVERSLLFFLDINGKDE